MGRFDELAVVKDDISEIKNTIEFLSGLQNDTNEKCNKLTKDMKVMESQNEELKRTVATQNVRLNALENAKLRNQCFLKLPTAKVHKDDLFGNVAAVAEAEEIIIRRDEVAKAMIQFKMSNENSTVIKVEFKDDSKKFEFLRNKSKLRALADWKDVFLFDVLSKDSAETFKYAKLLKEKGYAFVYHLSGRIYAKEKEGSHPIHITNKRVVDDILHGGHHGSFIPQRMREAGANQFAESRRNCSS